MSWLNAIKGLPKTQTGVVVLGVVSAIILSLVALSKFLSSRIKGEKQDKGDLNDQLHADIRRHKDGKESAVTRWANKHRFKPKPKRWLP